MQVWWVPVLPGWIIVLAWVIGFTVLELRFAGVLRARLGFGYTEAAAAIGLASALIPLACLFFPRGFIAAGRNALTYHFPFRRVRSVPWSLIRVGQRLKVVYRLRAGVKVPIRLPTVGLPRRRRRAIHTEIALRQEAATAKDETAGAQRDPQTD